METPAPTFESPPIPKWAIHRRLYNWTFSLAGHKHSMLVLALVSFTEAIFFPIPSLVLQIPMTLHRREKAWTIALVNSAANVIGGVVGYGVGYLFSDTARAVLLKIFSQSVIDHAHEYFGNLWLLTIGAIAVHPYKVYTVTAGLFEAPFIEFIVASILGRFGLFFVVAGLLYWIGPPAKTFIEKYFNIATIVIGVLAVSAIFLYRYLK